MVDPIDDIARQARQGSVSAIIQVLNEKLADSGIRTRAMLDNGVLQLLCEGTTADQIDQSALVDRIRQFLVAIGPRNIRRININARIVKEQQLLWLEEIKRDPDRQLLWSQEITLPKTNPITRWIEDWQYSRAVAAQAVPTPSPRDKRDKQQFWRGIVVGGASLTVLLLLVGWAIADWLGLEFPTRQAQTVTNPEPKPVAAATPAATVTPSPDPFVQAVRLAEQAAQEGQNATTAAQWLEIASRWQRASELMGQVPADDTRYSTAQNRIEVYNNNSTVALQKAESLQ